MMFVRISISRLCHRVAREPQYDLLSLLVDGREAQGELSAGPQSFSGECRRSLGAPELAC